MATYTDPTTIVTTSQPNAVQPSSVIILIGGFLMVLAAGFFFLQTSSTQRQTAATKTQIATKEAEIQTLASTANELASLNREAHNLHLLFDNKKVMPSILDMIAQRLHKDMAVTSIQITDKGALSLAGVVSDYVTYAKVYQAFNDSCGLQYFSTAKPSAVAKVVDAKTNVSYVSFTFDLVVQPNVMNAGSLNANPELLKKISECKPVQPS